MEKTKIMVISPPATGHINPMCAILNELCKNKQLDVIYYSDEEFRHIIEKSGAQFRLLCKKTFSQIRFPQVTKGRMGFGEMLDYMITFSFDLLPQLVAEFENENFDLIFYDGFFLPVKYLIEIIKTRHSTKVPKLVAFEPNFPVKAQTDTVNYEDSLRSTFLTLNAFNRQLMLSWKFGISVYNPVKIMRAHNDKLTIVAVMPELQPNREIFEDSFKFVGPCISEELRSEETDERLRCILHEFDVLAADPAKRSNLKLIYMSMGTLFGQVNFFVYDKVIEALQQFDNKPNRAFKLAQFRVVISMGRPIDEKYSLPDNILLFPKVPQLEVLKRADLFMTHCGMNSVTETIKFGVPIVAIPLDADQPVNARRICDELSLGVRLEPVDMNADDICNAIENVLSDLKYKKNAVEMSKTMAKYNGAVEAAKIIVDYINQSN